MTAKKRLIAFLFFLFLLFVPFSVSPAETTHKKKQETKKIVQVALQKAKPNKVTTKKRWISFEATFYNLCCNLTKSGRKLQDGVTVAVDPRIIPLGSWIEIEYPNGKIERRRADDTGSAIKGNILDVYVKKPTKVLLQMGRQDVKVRILSKEEIKQ